MLFTRRSIGSCLALVLAVSLVVDLTPVDASTKTNTPTPKKARSGSLSSSSSGSFEEKPKKVKDPSKKSKKKGIVGPGGLSKPGAVADTSGLGIPAPVSCKITKVPLTSGSFRVTTKAVGQEKAKCYEITVQDSKCFSDIRTMTRDLASKKERPTMSGELTVQSSAPIFAKILAYCRKYPNVKRTQEQKKTKGELVSAGKLVPRVIGATDDAWNNKFFASFTTPELFELVNAANFHGIMDLLDLGIGKIADMIKGKSTQEMRVLFGISAGSDGLYGFDADGPNSEAQIRKDNSWITGSQAGTETKQTK